MGKPSYGHKSVAAGKPKASGEDCVHQAGLFDALENTETEKYPGAQPAENQPLSHESESEAQKPGEIQEAESVLETQPGQAAQRPARSPAAAGASAVAQAQSEPSHQPEQPSEPAASEAHQLSASRPDANGSWASQVEGVAKLALPAVDFVRTQVIHHHNVAKA